MRLIPSNLLRLDALIRPGRPWPLGATPDGDGVNFAVFSAHASRIELCLFDQTGSHEIRRVELPERTDQVFHGYLPGAGPGQVYGLRAHGRWAPAEGHRFNDAKLLLDPYTRAAAGRFRWEGPNLVNGSDPFALDPRDSAPFVPKSVVMPIRAPSPASERPQVPWPETVIYEAHVKGLTRLHPAVPPEQQGTYWGLAHPAVLDHLLRLGITTIELLPVAAFLDEQRLVLAELRNYWGYNPVAFMVPEPRYAIGEPETEFCQMVQQLHGAGIEVILDLVFNHTGEGDHLGPTLSLRGLDNRSYYRLHPTAPGLYADHSGTGNSLNLGHPRVLQLVMDSLRHWASLGVDGFRLDLASSLGRDRAGTFTPDAAFFQAVAQDPQLRQLKFIAEPWDLGPGGYQPGGFPVPFAEWNDRFRDTVRRFWRGDAGILPDLATCLLASADRYDRNGRGPWTSINYVAAHDGFTTRDLVTYSRRHNEANGEQNRDGHADEHGSNYGHEGESDEPGLRSLRLRQRRNLLATLFLAQGTPMLLMGDEIGRSQRGNNNAYCQDGEVSWYPWHAIPAEEQAFRNFVARLIELRKAHPVLRRRHFLHGNGRSRRGLKDVTWLTRHGREKVSGDWRAPGNCCFGLLLDGAAHPDHAEDGHELVDDLLLILGNAGEASLPFVLPLGGQGLTWGTLLDTAADPLVPDRHEAGLQLQLPGRSLRLMRTVAG